MGQMRAGSGAAVRAAARAAVACPAPRAAAGCVTARAAAAFAAFFLAAAGCSDARSPAARSGDDAAASRSADLVLRGGRVYTMDAARSQAEAVAVGGGRIVYVGDDAGAAAWIGAGTRVVELDGRMVLPGFHDSHVHPVTGGIELLQCDLNGIGTADSIYRAVRRCAETRPELPWVVGGGWDLPIFPGANPRREALDRLVGDRPAYLTAADGHSAWVNSPALEVAGITADTPDPPDGRVERDAATGEPTGTLRESAMRLVSRHVPEPTAEEYREGLLRALAMANRFGITSLIEASAGERILETYRAADAAGELTARVLASQRVAPERGEAQIAELVARRGRYRTDRLRADAAKIFADGVIESGTAALLEPYVGSAGDRGRPNVAPEPLARLVRRLDAEGFQVHVHAIGDAAIRSALDAFQAATRAGGRRGARHHVAHIQLFDPADIPRFRELGVAANFQPLWAYADTYITELTEPVLGPERSRWLYPIRSVLETGAVVVAGSDWSVSSMNPLAAIQVALTRRPLEEPEGPAWIPEERAGLEDMLAAYTINGAWLARQEGVTGSLEPGKAADLIVLERDLFEVPPGEIHRVRVLWTLLEGREAYRDPGFAPSPGDG